MVDQSGGPFYGSSALNVYTGKLCQGDQGPCYVNGDIIGALLIVNFPGISTFGYTPLPPCTIAQPMKWIYAPEKCKGAVTDS